MKLYRALAICLLLSGSQPALAQSSDAYPERPVRIVVPFSPGGSVDITTRLIASKLQWTHPAIIENRAGAGSVIGTDVVARSPADGYTLLMTAPPFTTNAALHPKLPYNSMRDFTPVILTASAPLVVVVNPALPVHSIKELIEYAKAHPRQLSFGSSGNGGPQHLGGELFNAMAGVELVHVPYKGSGPATTDLLGGHVQLAFGDLLALSPYIKDGKLRAVAVTGLQRASSLPGIPTVAETVPGYEAMTWYGLLARAGTPPATIATLNAEIARVLKLPEVRERLNASGNDVVANSPTEFAAFIKAEIEKVTDLAKVANIKIE